MGLKSTSCFFLLAVLLVFSISTSTISAVNNITRTLEKYPNFSIMNDLFTKTGLTLPINKYQTITVLAVDNSAIGTISGRPVEELKNILMTHVLLDYYDELKLKGFKERSILMTTLYQTTGLGDRFNGFLNCTRMNGTILFGSAVKGSPLNVQYIDTVYHNPFNFSVVQISMPIVAPGLGTPLQASPSPTASPMTPFTPLPAPAPEKASTPVPHTAFTPLPAQAPKKGVNGPAPEPSDSTPGAAPSESSTHAPVLGDDDETADYSAPPSSSATSAGLSFGVLIFLGLVTSIAGFKI